MCDDRAAWEERRRRQSEYHERERQRYSAETQRLKSEYRQTRSARSSRSEAPDSAFRERSRKPYSKTNTALPIHTPKPSSPHVHFEKLDPKEYVKSATSRRATMEDTRSGSERRSSRTTRDAWTQTDPPKEESEEKKKDYDDPPKGYDRRWTKTDLPPVEKVYRAARGIKQTARRGTWDGSVVEEVFLEMTGVTIGDLDKMKSDWKN